MMLYDQVAVAVPIIQLIVKIFVLGFLDNVIDHFASELAFLKKYQLATVSPKKNSIYVEDFARKIIISIWQCYYFIFLLYVMSKLFESTIFVTQRDDVLF